MTAHAILGASSSKRWMNCPGSVRLSKDIPDQTSPYAREGTVAHEVVEAVLSKLTKGDAAHASDLVGVHIEVEGESIGVTEEMAVAAQVMVDHVWDRYEAHPVADIYLERTFDLSKINAPEPMFGTADVVIWDEGRRHLEVIDYKHGQGVVVEAHENPQLMYYALGATVSIGKIPETIRVTIVQPRAEHPEGFIRSYDFDRARLIQFKDELFEAARATQAEDAPLAVGDWCKFCKAKVHCTAQLDHAQSVAMVEFQEEPRAPVAPQGLTPEQLYLVVERAPLIMEWLRDVEAYALGVLQDGGDIPGLKLVEGRAYRKWIDEEAAEKYLQGKGFKKAERTTSKVVSPAQAERLMKAAGHSLDHLRGLWYKPLGGKTKLALDHDPRPALPSRVESDFGPGEDPTQ